MLSNPTAIIGTILAIVGAIFGMFKSYETVPQGSIGMMFFMGRAITKRRVNDAGEKVREDKMVDPGGIWYVPGIMSVKHRHVVSCVMRSGLIPVRFGDGTTYEIEICLLYSIRRGQGVRYALCEVSNYDEWLRNVLDSVVTHVCGSLNQYEPYASLRSALMSAATSSLDGHGITLNDLSITHYAGTFVTQLREQGLPPADVNVAGLAKVASIEAHRSHRDQTTSGLDHVVEA